MRGEQELGELFAICRLKLALNAHKGTWKGMSMVTLHERLGQEMREFFEARDAWFRAGSALESEKLLREVVLEAADVVNYVMMIVDNLGGLTDMPPKLIESTESDPPRSTTTKREVHWNPPVEVEREGES